MALTTLKNKIRFLLGDNSISGKDVFTYENSKVFTLTESNVIAIEDVMVNDTSSAVTYTYNSSTKKVTIGSPLVSGDNIVIEYTYYSNYSDTELLSYIQASLVHLSINNYEDFEYDIDDDAIYPDLDDREENLIAVITSLLIEPNNKTIRLPDVTISVPSDYPTEEKIKHVISAFKRDSRGIFGLL